MKLALAALFLIGATSAPAFAGGPRIRHHGDRTIRYEENCYKKVERYIPGYYDRHGNWRHGYVKRYTKKVPCRGHHHGPIYMPQTTPDSFPRYEEEHPNVGNVDNNSCVEGTVAGGLLGGALGGVLSKKDNWIWAIPSGIVAGSMIGCQVDGG